MRLLASFLIPLLTASAALAEMPEEDYLAVLGLADKRVETKKNAAAARDAASPGKFDNPALSRMTGHNYRVGETWDVAAWRMERPIARMSDDDTHLDTLFHEAGIFRYEVITVNERHEITLSITQLEAHGMKIVDPKVPKLTLTLTSDMVETGKSITLEGSPLPIPLSPNGVRPRMLHSSLEVFPLDVPDVLSAERLGSAGLELPASIQSFASRVGYHPDLSQSSWFHQDDFFGRPIRVLWKRGEPWPAYLKTANGISILIREGSS